MEDCKFISVKKLSEATGYAESQIYKALQKREENGLKYGVLQERSGHRVFINQLFFENWAERNGLSKSCKRKPKASVTISTKKFEELFIKQCKLKLKNDKAEEIIYDRRIQEMDRKQNGKNFVGRILSRIWR